MVYELLSSFSLSLQSVSKRISTIVPHKFLPILTVLSHASMSPPVSCSLLVRCKGRGTVVTLPDNRDIFRTRENGTVLDPIPLKILYISSYFMLFLRLLLHPFLSCLRP